MLELEKLQFAAVFNFTLSRPSQLLTNKDRKFQDNKVFKEEVVKNKLRANIVLS